MILINPQFNRDKKLGIFSKYVPISVPIAIGTLASYLMSKGKQAKILDDQVTPITAEVLHEYVKGLSQPYIFGISTLTAGCGRAYQIAELIKKEFPGAYVIMGGIHPTVLPEEVLSNKNIDIAVRREGDETAVLLYDALKNGRDYTKTLGISYRDKEGKIIHNPNAPLLADLNQLPPFPYHLFEPHADRYELGFILSSRGCPYDCIFCSQRQISERWYRYLKPQRVVQELEVLINKYKIKEIGFFDDNFVVNKNYVKELCELICEKGLNKKATFSCQTRGDAVNDEILDYLKKAGFNNICFGLETGSERLMKMLKKGETVEQNKTGVKLARKHGFTAMASFMFGLPTETKEDRKMAWQMVKEIGLDIARFNNATPYPGTELYEIAKKEGGLNPGENWENLCACGTFVEGPFHQAPLAYCPTTSTPKEVRRDILKANFFFWVKPKQIFELLKTGSVATGWFILPKKWYLKPKEWYYMGILATRVILSYIKTVILNV